MSRGQLDVVVVGGGVVGAALALGLAQQELRVALVDARGGERWSVEADPDLRVFAIAPGNAALLDRVGAWQSVVARRAFAYRRMRVWDAGGGGELDFRATELARERLGWIVEQRLLLDALWRQLEASAGLRLHAPARVEDFSQDDEGVRLGLDDGSTLRAALAVAADGAASPLRRMAGIEAPRHDYGQRGLVAYIETGAGHGDTAWQRFLPGGPLALLPAGERRVSIVWSLPVDEAERLLACDEEVFSRELERAADSRLGAMRLVSARAAFPLARQLADRYVHGRLLLAGDAAHQVHPLAGQGVNLGLQDARALLDGVARRPSLAAGPSLQRLLRGWERERRSENAAAAWTFESLNRLFSNDDVPAVLLRGRLLGLADRIGPLKQALARHAIG